MMHECKRLLNHSTGAEGLLIARTSEQRTKATSMDAFLVPQPSDTNADADSDATDRTGMTPDDYSENESDEALPPDITSNDAAATVADTTGKK